NEIRRLEREQSNIRRRIATDELRLVRAAVIQFDAYAIGAFDDVEVRHDEAGLAFDADDDAGANRSDDARLRRLRAGAVGQRDRMIEEGAALFGALLTLHLDADDARHGAFDGIRERQAWLRLLRIATGGE